MIHGVESKLTQVMKHKHRLCEHHPNDAFAATLYNSTNNQILVDRISMFLRMVQAKHSVASAVKGSLWQLQRWYGMDAIYNRLTPTATTEFFVACSTEIVSCLCGMQFLQCLFVRLIPRPLCVSLARFLQQQFFGCGFDLFACSDQLMAGRAVGGDQDDSEQQTHRR